MLRTYRRHGVVLALLLATGLAGIALRPAARPAALPSAMSLVQGTRWRAVGAYRPGGWPGLAFQEWKLRDTGGRTALLYIGVASKVQTMVHWSGELGYEGEGYEVTGRSLLSVPLRDGTTATASGVTVKRGADVELLAYAVVGPDGIAASAQDNPLRTAWDTLRGADGPWYLARVAVRQGAGDAATARAVSLLGPVLARLQALARSSGA